MLTLINNKLVTTIKASDKPIEVRDTQLKGLILRVQPSGIKTYFFEYTRGKRVKVGRADTITPAQARNIARAIMAEYYQGGDPSNRRSNNHQTLADFVDGEFYTWAKANIKTADSTVNRVKSSFKELLDYELTDISPWLVEKWRSARLKDGIKETSINRELCDLKSLFSKALKWSIIDSNPLTSVKLCKVDPSPKPRFLKPDEEKKLRNALDKREERIRRERESGNKWKEDRGYELLPDLNKVTFADYLKPITLLVLNTGLRRGEVFKLKWDDVDLANAVLTVAGSGAKSGKTRHIPLNDEALYVLQNWRKQSSDENILVFPNKDGKVFDHIRRSWANLMEDAQITDFRFHDCRHHFASMLAMSGVDLNTIRDLLGHSDLNMTLRYSHLSREHKRSAVQKLNKGSKKQKRAKKNNG